MSCRSTIPPFMASAYAQASTAAVQGQYAAARTIYQELLRHRDIDGQRSRLLNDLAVVEALLGATDSAEACWTTALSLDADHPLAARNCELSKVRVSRNLGRAVSRPKSTNSSRPARVAILSLLFNWPSTGGGIVHTLELADFLTRAGYEVKHFFARNEPWGTGRVQSTLPYEHLALDFEPQDWNARAIQARFRHAVQSYDPDFAIITDSWNFKPLLAEAVAPIPYLLRLQAMECVCPLNNVRLLPGPSQCGLHQLASDKECRNCVAQLGHQSGSLHRAERALSHYGTDRYATTLRKAMREAHAVLVVNELTKSLLAPYCRRVEVVPSGFDPKRFPWPWVCEPARWFPENLITLFFGAFINEGLKGYHVLEEACRRLWHKRRDFRVVITADAPPNRLEFARYIGWRSQASLPADMRAADIIVAPAIAQEALGRTAVEAMGVGRPVVASRIGGLPETISDGAGLLANPSDPVDLAAQIELLLDDPLLRTAMGTAGRRRFERHFTWDVIIHRHYRPLLVPIAARSASAGGAP